MCTYSYVCMYIYIYIYTHTHICVYQIDPTLLRTTPNQLPSPWLTLGEKDCTPEIDLRNHCGL